MPELDRIVLKDTTSERPFASTATCRKAVFTTRVLGLVHELCTKQIHVTKRDLFYTDVKLFEVRILLGGDPLQVSHSCVQDMFEDGARMFTTWRGAQDGPHSCVPITYTQVLKAGIPVGMVFVQ